MQSVIGCKKQLNILLVVCYALPVAFHYFVDEPWWRIVSWRNIRQRRNKHVITFSMIRAKIVGFVRCCWNRNFVLSIQLRPMRTRKFWLLIAMAVTKFWFELTSFSHAPEAFNEFYNQRRRWVPSTMCNILDLLGDAKSIVQKNNSISMPYIFYQGMLMVGTILGPGTIFLMMVGALVSVFAIDIWTSFLWNFFPLLIFMTICYFCKQKYQVSLVILSVFYKTHFYTLKHELTSGERILILILEYDLGILCVTDISVSIFVFL